MAFLITIYHLFVYSGRTLPRNFEITNDAMKDC